MTQTSTNKHTGTTAYLVTSNEAWEPRLPVHAVDETPNNIKNKGHVKYFGIHNNYVIAMVSSNDARDVGRDVFMERRPVQLGVCVVVLLVERHVGVDGGRACC